MMDQMQNDQPSYREPTEEDDIECSEECPKVYCRGMGWWDRELEWIREEFRIGEVLPIPPAMWESLGSDS